MFQRKHPIFEYYFSDKGPVITIVDSAPRMSLNTIEESLQHIIRKIQETENDDMEGYVFQFVTPENDYRGVLLENGWLYGYMKRENQEVERAEEMDGKYTGES